MTNEKAIETLKQLILQGTDERLKNDYEAIDLAIKALEEKPFEINVFLENADEETLEDIKNEIQKVLDKLKERNDG